jgi:benzil reductase ((S)-benzoin forming)
MEENMKVVIITGGSKGLGLAMVEAYCKKGFKVISIARTIPSFEHPNLYTVTFDLSKVESYSELECKLENVLPPLFSVRELTLINNAGILGDIAPIDKCTTESIDITIRTNLTAPLLLSAMFVKKIKSSRTSLTIYMLSSGAAITPYHGWTAYCASKSGLELAVKTIALEQINNSNFKILSLNPGVMDTTMQDKIRSSSVENFAQIDRFIQLKDENLLPKPAEIANKIIQIEKLNKFKSGESVSLKAL